MSDPILINYIELQSNNLTATKEFYGNLFGWEFVDYGEAYMSFTNAGIDGGFFLCEQVDPGENRTILYDKQLEQVREKVLAANVELTKDIYSFPGGRRFEFNDPSGNRLAVWSE
jgi:predicted enzyme related to lactoylglutathione lyase